MGKPKGWKLVMIVGTAVLCIFCAAQVVSQVRYFAKTSAADVSCADALADTPGGSAGGGTFTVKGTVNNEGDGIIFKHQKSCAVENFEVLKGYEGHHVKVTGRIGADKKAIHVMGVKSLGSEEKAAQETDKNK